MVIQCELAVQRNGGYFYTFLVRKKRKGGYHGSLPFRRSRFVKSHNIELCTKKGIIKKTALEEFSRPRVTGVNAINIIEGDELHEAKMTDGHSEIMMGTY